MNDLNLRKTVKNNLMKILNGNGQERITAAKNLIDLETESLSDAEAVRNTIRLSARQPENQNNPFIQLLSAKVDLNKAIADKQTSFNLYVNSTGDEKNIWYQNAQKQVLNYEKQLQKSIDAASGLDTSNGRRLPNSKISRIESSWINTQLSELYQQLEEPDKVMEREMIARFYTVDDNERGSLEFRMGTPRIGMDGTVFSSGWFPKSRTSMMKSSDESIPQLQRQTQNQPVKKELAEEPYKRETQTYERNFKVIEQKYDGKRMTTGIQEGHLIGYERNYQVEGSLKTEGIKEIEYTTKKEFKQKRRTITESTKTYIQETNKGNELNRAGTTRAFVTAGRVGGIEIFNNNFPIVADYFTQRSLIERLKKEKAERISFLQNNYPIPPEPKDLPRVKLRVEREVGKEKAQAIMKKIEEMSYAVWGNL